MSLKSCIIYDKQTGRILRSGSCPASMFEAQCHPEKGESIIEGVADDVTQKISQGLVVDKTQQEIEDEKQAAEESLRSEQGEETVMVPRSKLDELIGRVEKLESSYPPSSRIP